MGKLIGVKPYVHFLQRLYWCCLHQLEAQDAASVEGVSGIQEPEPASSTRYAQIANTHPADSLVKHMTRDGTIVPFMASGEMQLPPNSMYSLHSRS